MYITDLCVSLEEIYHFMMICSSLQLETKQTLSKFEGSSSISSDDFFGGGPRSSHGSSHYSGTDLSDIKEGVRQGVTKVAGKLSSLANGVMSSLQVNVIYTAIL